MAPGVYELLLRVSYHDMHETVPYTVQVKPTSYQTSLVDYTFHYDGSPKDVVINVPRGYIATDIRYQPYYITWQPVDPSKGSPDAQTEAGEYYVTARLMTGGAGIHETFHMRILPAESRPQLELGAADIPPAGAPAYDPLAGRPGYDGAAEYEATGGAATVSGNLVAVHAPGSVLLRYKPAPSANYLGPYQYVQLYPADTAPYRASAEVKLILPANPVYDGTPHPVGATTEPPGLDVLVQYERQVYWPEHMSLRTEAPFDTGDYYVTAHVVSPGYEGGARYSLTISKATATIQLAGESFVFDGTYRRPPVAVTTTPPGLPARITMPGYYSENGYYYFRPGSYTVSASLDPSLKLNYTAEPVQTTITCLRRPLTIRLDPATGLPEGKLTLRITPRATAPLDATYTGTLVVRDGTFPVKGMFTHIPFTENPDFNRIISTWTLPYPRAISPIRYRLELSLEDVLVAKLHGYREHLGKPVLDAPFVLESEPTPGLLAAAAPAKRPSWAGRLTLLLRDARPLADALLPMPLGPGFATADLDAKDVLTLRGKLGDGQPFTASTPLAVDHGARLFINAYKRPDSHLAGWLAFLPHPTLPGRLHVSDESGSDLYWRKTANPSDIAHRRGLPPLALTATLDPWSPPPAGFTFPAPRLRLAPQVASSSASFEAARPKLDAKTGLFTQRITLLDPELAARLGLPALARRTVTASGILRQPPPGDALLGAGQLPLATSPEFVAEDAHASEIVFESAGP